LYLESIHIRSFRNYEQASFAFSEDLNIISGPNGSGKTNLLDAIYYLCVGKSYFNGLDGNNVKHGDSYFRIEGKFFVRELIDRVTVAYKLNDSKFIARNGNKYERLAEHTGRFPVVVIEPDDTLLVVHGSEVRRRLFDQILSQAHQEYLDALLQYNRTLQQRNTLLKQLNSSIPNDLLLESYDNLLHQYGHIIHQYRNNVLQEISADVNEYYRRLCNGKEVIHMVYESELKEADLIQLLRGSRSKDIEWQRTTVGIHRDDYTLYLNEKLLKKAGSQGQKKTAIVALKLALYQYIKRHTDTIPLLLLDDVFDKLDESRLINLLSLIDSKLFGQVLITDTEKERVQHALTGAHKKLNYIYLT
jgi:DNA replication and repair protein RecF